MMSERFNKNGDNGLYADGSRKIVIGGELGRMANLDGLWAWVPFISSLILLAGAYYASLPTQDASKKSVTPTPTEAPKPTSTPTPSHGIEVRIVTSTPQPSKVILK